jgi:hypothetical protein
VARERLLSQAARLALLKACLASIPIYLMSIIKFLMWAIDAINSWMGKFLWDDQAESRKYYLANWQSLTQKKEHGDMGIPDLRDMNLCLLASWIQRYQTLTPSFREQLLMLNIELIGQTFFAALINMVLPFGKE